ncbi:TetR/AcrR family transcriptional regulator [Rahnella aquatilis]|uniref:TetR/AcrR family transcriptional regulator n=1 Tax=Rahnella aquatilis TaxID=34038 RepID=UPI0036545382
MSSSRPGGRSSIVRAKVLVAVYDLLAAKSPQNITMPEIAQRAGVAATSLYRRWGDVGSLLLDMAADRLSQKWPLPDEGSIERDLRLWSGKIVEGLSAPEEPTFLRVLFASWDVAPERRTEMLAPRYEQLHAMLQRSKERGERTPTQDEVIDHLLAPIYMRALLGLNVDKPFAERLVTRLLKHPTADE